MYKVKNLNYLGLTLLLLILLSYSANAQIGAYRGFVENDRVNEGDRVRFSGTFYNYIDSTVYVFSMNVSFVENLGPGSNRDPSRPNASKLYDETNWAIASNASLTDSIVTTIDFDPGSYNVSIFFVYSNSTPSAVADYGTVYALENATLVVEGLTQALEAVRIVGIIIGAVAVVIIGVLIYNSKFKK